MSKMFEKIKISRIEQRLLFLSTIIIPFSTICVILAIILIQIYDYIFPPLPKFSPDGWGVDPILAWFRLFTSVCLAISAVLIVYKRVIFSTLVTALPLFAFAIWIYTVHSRIQEFIEPSNSSFNDRSLLENVYNTLNLVDVVFLCFLSSLLFWQFSILLRMLIKNTQRKNVLP